MKLYEIIKTIEEAVPKSLQESYDNSGLQVGDTNRRINKILINLDCTEKLIDEAIEKKADLIVTHHPLLFSGIKRVSKNTEIERIIHKSIQHEIAIYAMHTNLDCHYEGVSRYIGKKLELENIKTLEPKDDFLYKLAVFIPEKHVELVKSSIFEAGAGYIGNYDCCSFNTSGLGTFRALENAKPYVGKKNETHTEQEIKTEIIVPKHLLSKVVFNLLKAHPYEEPAYDIYPVANKYEKAGLGIIGNLKEPMKEIEFLKNLKNTLSLPLIKHTVIRNKPIKTVAFCGGSGSSLIYKAMQKGADIYITGDIKYHDFFNHNNKIILADIGHFESEIHTKDLMFDLLIKKFPTFAVEKSEINTNPINYL